MALSTRITQARLRDASHTGVTSVTEFQVFLRMRDSRVRRRSGAHMCFAVRHSFSHPFLVSSKIVNDGGFIPPVFSLRSCGSLSFAQCRQCEVDALLPQRRGEWTATDSDEAAFLACMDVVASSPSVVSSSIWPRSR